MPHDDSHKIRRGLMGKPITPSAVQANTDPDNFHGRTRADRAVNQAMTELPRVVGSAATRMVSGPLRALSENNPSGQMRRQIENQMRDSRGGRQLSANDRREADRLIAEAAAATRARRAAGEIVERQPLPDELVQAPEVGYVDHTGRRRFPR